MPTFTPGDCADVALYFPKPNPFFCCLTPTELQPMKVTSPSIVSSRESVWKCEVTSLLRGSTRLGWFVAVPFVECFLFYFENTQLSACLRSFTSCLCVFPVLPWLVSPAPLHRSLPGVFTVCSSLCLWAPGWSVYFQLLSHSVYSVVALDLISVFPGPNLFAFTSDWLHVYRAFSAGKDCF